jgi:hypothetical protein
MPKGSATREAMKPPTGRGGYGHESLKHINAKPHYVEEYKMMRRVPPIKIPPKKKG